MMVVQETRVLQGTELINDTGKRRIDEKIVDV